MMDLISGPWIIPALLILYVALLILDLRATRRGD